MPQEYAPMPQKKKQRSEPKLKFSIGEVGLGGPGAVYDPGQSKEKDFELDQESAIYRAIKGQGGDRRRRLI